MKTTKILLALAITACTASTLVHAGGMGAAKKTAPQPKPFLIPFLAGEGMYTWPQVDGYHATLLNASVGGQTQDVTLTSDNVNRGWGGRLAGGFLHPMSGRMHSFLGSLEAGWGYYGSMDMNPVAKLSSGTSVMISTSDAQMTMKQYGVDLLAGLVYDRPDFDLFFKAGALIQNLKMSVLANPQAIASASGVPFGRLVSALQGKYAIAPTMVNVLPMLRLGGGYHINKNKNWLVTASWMHAFGSTLNIRIPDINFASSSLGGLNAKLASPSLDSVMFGLEYRFG
ncbi:MAG: hypothetical protein P1U39_02610 [Legionellaceae bacterium]|nr:hypothetical protein [Legionellaceae bacterium]